MQAIVDNLIFFLDNDVDNLTYNELLNWFFFILLQNWLVIICLIFKLQIGL